MIEDTKQRGAEACGSGCGPRQGPTAMCSMAACAGMMKKRPTGYSAMVAGILLIIVGALIFVEPRILVWLAGAALVFIGVMLLMMTRFIRRLGERRTS